MDKTERMTAAQYRDFVNSKKNKIPEKKAKTSVSGKPVKKKSLKYGNKKIVNEMGVFDSTKEYNIYLKLLQRVKMGEITDLHRQVEFVLIPTQYETVIKQLKTKSKEVHRVKEHGVSYFADYVYFDVKSQNKVVIDVKSEITRKNAYYILKRKLMLFLHNISIVEL